MTITRTAALVAISVICVSGCATKRYPVATPLSAAERAAYSCRELHIELVKAEEVQLKVTQTAETDWRSIAGFLGDYGIGNAMAKSEADKAIAERISGIRAAQIEKNCVGSAIPPVEAAPPVATPPATTTPPS